MKYIPIEKYSQAQSDRLLGSLLNAIYRSNTDFKTDLAKILLYKFANKGQDGIEIEGESLTVFESLFFNSTVILKALEFVAPIYIHYTLVRIMLDVIETRYNNTGRTNIPFGLKRIFTIYKNSYTKKELQFLVNESMNLGNNPVINFINGIMDTQFKKFAKKPDWVVPIGSLVEQSKIKPLTKEHRPTLNKYEMLELIKKNYELNGIEILNYGEMVKHISKMSPIERYNLISPFLEDKIKIKDKVYFQAYGPSNPFRFPSEDDMKDSRDRMLQCNYFEINPDTLESSSFEGSCWMCKDHIKYKWYSVRAPIPNGGWKGWFCSWKCTAKWIKEVNEYEDIDLYRTAILIKKFQEEINIYKIRDRLPDNKNENS
uniref:Putative transmembrane protein n=1 Tax=Pithovirus LCPAC001 TaxID=2506585 RepID=A0A481Z1M2_9VIRU|nr:MAG: putative transmembrane protein [Pithovirus LCPAC001]